MMIDSSPRSSLWNVPYQRNPIFTGREQTLSQLYKALYAENSVALSHPQSISGLGGIGKTQTALEYVYRYGANYEVVFWLQADSAATLISGYMALAQTLHLPEKDNQDQRVIVEAVLRWLRTSKGWLLVFDNLDDFAGVDPLLPKAFRGHILFTTRAFAFGSIAQRLEVKKMDPDTGALLLLRRTSKLSPQSLLDEAILDDRSVACEISQELDGLPLALDQAGAYIKEIPCSFRDYLTLYKTRHQEQLLQSRGNSNMDYPASVATTWSLSFEKVRQANPASAELLNFCAFLAPNAIPEEILTSGASHLGAILAPTITNPIQFDRLYKDALRFSLLQRQSDEHLFTLHRLVQAVLRNTLSNETRLQWMRRAVFALEATYPAPDFANWPTFERLQPHALTCVAWIEQAPLDTPEAARLLIGAGGYMDDRALYAEAEPLLQRSLEIQEHLWGPDHLDTAISLDKLAVLYYHQGRYTEAEPFYERALAIREQQLGDEHTSTALSLTNLAELYQAQGRYERAELFLKRALTINEQKLGITHLETANSSNNLAELYRIQGKYKDAEPLYQRALQIYKQQLGEKHPHTANIFNNLALLFQAQEKYEKAEPLSLCALEIYEEMLGSTHPHTANSLNNLANLYYLQGKYGNIEPLYQRALAIAEQRLGPNHPDLALNLNNLAELYRTQGRFEEAEPLYQRALAICEQQLGGTHINTARNLNNLALLYHNQGKYGEAEPLYLRALVIWEQTFGATHSTTASMLSNLANLYYLQGKYEEAAPLLKRALDIWEPEYGTNHPEIQSMQQHYLSLLQTLRRDVNVVDE